MSTVVVHPEVFHTPQRKIRLLLAGLPFFAGLLSPDGQVLECNFGPLGGPLDERSDWVGASFETGPWWNYSEESRSEILIMMGRARDGERVSKERLYRRTDGMMGVMMLTLDPLYAPYGQPDAILVMAVDVTERRRATETAAHIAHDMAHRLRNSFTIMRLLATHNTQGGDAQSDAAMSARLSLVRAGHDLAFRYLFFEVPIEDVVRVAAASVPDTMGREAPTLSSGFAPVSVPSEHVQALLLALGELAAAGHPARVDAERRGRNTLRLRWVEAQPRLQLPRDLSRQIVDGLLAMQVGGTVTVNNAEGDNAGGDNAEGGFTWQLDMPIDTPLPPAAED